MLEFCKEKMIKVLNENIDLKVQIFDLKQKLSRYEIEVKPKTEKEKRAEHVYNIMFKI